MIKNKKILIGILLGIIIIICCTFIFFKTKNGQLNSSINRNGLNINNNISSNEENKYEYKAFKPRFYNSPSDTGPNNYDFTHDMTYSNRIYYRKLNSYEEYKEVKTRWNDIIDMKEDDFQNYFMVITAIENTSMVGLTLDSIDTDDNNMYISLIHYKDGEEYNKDETCISCKISRELERDNIYVTRNYLDNEKDFNTDMKLAVNKNNPSSFIYKTEIYRDAERDLNNKIGMSIAQENWQDYIKLNIEINKNTPEIDFSKWNRIGDDFYSISLTKHSEYLKFMNNYNAQEINWETFKYAYPIIIVRRNAENSIHVGEITNEKGQDYLHIFKGGYLDVTENFKYPAICLLVPNFRSLENSKLNIMLDGEYRNLSNDTDEIQQAIDSSKYSKEQAYNIGKRYIDNFTYDNFKFSNTDLKDVRMTNVYANNFLTANDKEYHSGNLVEDKTKTYWAWEITSYSDTDPCTYVIIYVDSQTGEIVAGKVLLAMD